MDEQTEWLLKILIPVGIALLGWMGKMLWNAAIDAVKRYVNREIQQELGELKDELAELRQKHAAMAEKVQGLVDRFEKLIDRLIQRNS